MELEIDFKALKTTVNDILDLATTYGASEAVVAVNESATTAVETLKGSIENFETSYDAYLSLTVYCGGKKSSVGTSVFDDKRLKDFVKNAVSMANYTEEDSCNGIAPRDLLVNDFVEDLELFNPVSLGNDELIAESQNLEHLVLGAKDISSNGAALSLSQYRFILASTNRINHGYSTTRYSSSISLIGNGDHGMQTDYWYDNKRCYHDLETNQKIADIATMRTSRRLVSGGIKSGNYPVIFEFPIARSIIGNFLEAISGNNLYRRLSFLNDSLGTEVFPSWLNISEDPFLVRGLSSCYFDNEGVRVGRRDLVKDGVISGYLLNCYNARKMNMVSTGNSGGAHNVIVTPNFHGDLTKLAKEMGKGLIVIETIGHGLNLVTGDYSVGASGLWVENGEIQYFVDNLTIAGNLHDIFANIKYIADDGNIGSINCGSMLVAGINVAAK